MAAAYAGELLGTLSLLLPSPSSWFPLHLLPFRSQVFLPRV